ARMVQFLSAHVAAIGAAVVEIRTNGLTIARRAKSKHPPIVGNVTVRPDVIPNPTDNDHDDRHGKGDHGRDDRNADGTAAVPRVTSINWIANDPDHDALTAKVDYSADGGQTFRTIFFGPNKDGVVLSSALFKNSMHGLVRVRINDGF